MKPSKLVVLFLVVCCLVACKKKESGPVETKVGDKEGYTVRNFGSCEYIQYTYDQGCGSNGMVMFHKGDCPNPVHKQ